MLHALKAELAYFRPWLLGGLGIAAGVMTILTVVFLAVGKEGPPQHVAATLRGFFPIIAGMVVGFIAQSLRSEERRARLLLAGPLTPLQLAGIAVLLPAILFGFGLLASAVVMGVESLITGRLPLESLRGVGGIAGVLFAVGQTGPLAQEATAAHRQRRSRSAFIGWTIFTAAILLLSASQLVLGSVPGILGLVAIALLAMVTSTALFLGRTDFTR